MYVWVPGAAFVEVFPSPKFHFCQTAAILLFVIFTVPELPQMVSGDSKKVSTGAILKVLLSKLKFQPVDVVLVKLLIKMAYV